MKVAIDKEIEATAGKNIFNQPVASCPTAGSVMAQGKGKVNLTWNWKKEAETLEGVCQPRSLLHSSYLESTWVKF